MDINFELLENEVVDSNVLLEIIKTMYNYIKTNVRSNVVINEFVDNVTSELHTDEFTLEVSATPVSVNDILIVSEDGTIIITPNSIIELNRNKIKIKSSKVKKNMNFFVTYKY